ncbi:MAG: FAD-binding oxidoreductase [Acidimicrobiales bacterium]
MSAVRSGTATSEAQVDAALVADLRAALAPDRVHARALELALYGRDASIVDPGDAAAVCFPLTTAEVRACVQIALRHGRPFVPRGSGTGLSGGAVPIGRPVVIVTTKMDRIVSVDLDDEVAWVEPGVINLDLTRALLPHGVHFAPDPSSQQACSIGGNVANNSGGPHCLAYGVTSAHVLAIEVVLPDGSVTTLGGLDAEPAGYDLRGAFVGSEGTLGIATKIAVRLTPNPPAVRTMLLDFLDVEQAAAAVSRIIAAGIVPAALEMMDQRITRAAEEFVHAGLPTDAAAVLLVEVDGLPDGVAAGAEVVSAIGTHHGARTVRIAQDEAERQLLWKARKTAFGAVARIAPNYYLHDTVVPRTRLVDVLRQVYEIAERHELMVLNVFHAGDGNLHPLLVFDARQPGVLPRVHAAGEEIVQVSLAAGGVLSGEHGIGLEKRDFMPLLFSADDLDAQARLREAFDPDGVANPTKVLPEGSRCGDLQRIPEGVWV